MTTTTMQTTANELCQLAKQGDAAGVRAVVDAGLDDGDAAAAMVAVRNAMCSAAKRGHDDVLDVLLTRVVVGPGDERYAYEQAIFDAYNAALRHAQPATVARLLPIVPQFRKSIYLDASCFDKLTYALDGAYVTGWMLEPFIDTYEPQRTPPHERLRELFAVVDAYIRDNHDRFSEDGVDAYREDLLAYKAFVEDAIAGGGLTDECHALLVADLDEYARTM